jgi:protein gp37
MADRTGIEWCDSTANIFKGCTKVSPGCDNCYAEELFGTEGGRFRDTVWGPGGDRIYIKAGWATIRKFQRAAARNGGIDPLLGRKRRIFVNSVSDLFDNHKSIVWRPDFWNLVRECPDLIFILVTKRPINVKRMVPAFFHEIASRIVLLTSVENQEFANLRLWHLAQSLAHIAPPLAIGVSYEPALERVDFTQITIKLDKGHAIFNAITGMVSFYLVDGDMLSMSCPTIEAAPRAKFRPLDWIIMGGESGKGHRDMDELWAIDTRAAIIADNLHRPVDIDPCAFFFKQMAGKSPVPPYLLTREFPRSFGDWG